MTTQRTTVHIPQDTFEKLDAWAERIQRSRNWLVVQAIEAYIEADQNLDRELEEMKRLKKFPSQKAGKR